MPFVPIPMTLNDIRSDLGRRIGTAHHHRHIHTLIRHIGNIKWVRNSELRLLRFINNMPVRVVGIVAELEGYLIMVVPFGIEVGCDILSEHETVDDGALRTVVFCPVDIVALDLDVGSVCLLVLVPGRVIRVIPVLGTGALVVLEEIHCLGSLRMASIIFIDRISPCDERPFVLAV